MKEVVAAELNVPIGNQQFIAYGKRLEDTSKTLADYNLKENDFLILFITKVTLVFLPFKVQSA